LDNAAALALYEDLGFERLDERLTIAARDIAA
jgi:ribosomal protein S18 acetylase RimI-like enzyme